MEQKLKLLLDEIEQAKKKTDAQAEAINARFAKGLITERESILQQLDNLDGQRDEFASAVEKYLSP